MKKIILITLVLIFVLISNFDAYALMEGTHQAINEEVAQRNITGFSFDTYLKNQLGFSKSVTEELNGIDADGINIKKKVFWWLGYGGLQEDRPGSRLDFIRNKPTRPVNHFHNPLKPWDEAGLNDTLKLPDFSYFPAVIWTERPYIGQSSVLWAQNPNQNLGGKWSWWDAREYFYVALTGRNFYTGNVVDPLPGETEMEKRERYFTKTLRAVGQQMHIVEDASVPDRKSTRLNSSHTDISRMPSSA